MAQKKITDLTLRSDFDATCNIPVDDTSQTWRATGQQIADFVEESFGPVVLFTKGWSATALSGSITTLTPGTVVTDTASGLSGSSYTVPSAGYYDISAQVWNTGTPASIAQATGVYIYKNGSALFARKEFAGSASGNYWNPIVTLIGVSLAANDVITIRADSEFGSASLMASDVLNFFCLKKTF